ncbi:hypothetical protein LINGRAHAP2_LOCUS4056, partial [Linum grandiflorum]
THARLSAHVSSAHLLNRQPQFFAFFCQPSPRLALTPVPTPIPTIRIPSIKVGVWRPSDKLFVRYSDRQKTFVKLRRISSEQSVMGKEQWRCSPQKMLHLWKLTSPGRRDMLRESGFGFIEFLSFTAFKSEIILFIAKNFRSSSASVTIRSGVNIKLMEEHIQRIYGLPRGTTLISDYMENPLVDVKTWGGEFGFRGSGESAVVRGGGHVV